MRCYRTIVGEATRKLNVFQERFIIIISVLTVIVVGVLIVDLSFAAEDKNGVSPNTISLPSGPGSIEGLGESFQPMLNTGTARYKVKIAMPPGVAGNTPELSLQYDSGFGDGPAGIGWTYGPGSISRQVDKGLPRYVDGPNGMDDDHDGEIDEPDEEDTFIGPDGEELVRVSENTYRARIEGNFARYRKLNNRWEVDLKSGTVLTFGATPSARISDETGVRVFRWLLEKSTDNNGNVIEYSYAGFSGSDNQKYLKEIRYGSGTSSWNIFYFAYLTYENRQDWRKDYRSGFLVKTAMRLAGIHIGIQGVQPQQTTPGDWNNDSTPDSLISRYAITYDDSTSHISHLTKIARYGSDGLTFLPPVSFTYSPYAPPASISAKEGAINSENVPGSVMDNELVEFIDLNRDGLPDILKTDFYGNSHTAYRNLGPDLQGNKEIIRWDDARIMLSEDMLALPLHLAKDRVSLADMNGDGISDLVHTALSNEVFYYPNQGDFSWGARQPMSILDTAPPAPFAFDSVESTDLDFNKRMDVVMSTGNGYALWFNYEDGKYSREVRTEGATWNGRVLLFSDSGFQFADVNGDRLNDAVRVTPTHVVYCASMGYGLFAGAVEIPIPDTVLTDDVNGQIKRAKLTDVNGDGLDDLVVERAQANELWIWLNQGTDSFSKKYVITDMPTQFGPNTAIRWADLNGNGTTDLIYADSSAASRLRMIDLGELVSGSAHPNLLTTIDNGLGAVTTIGYKSSTVHYLSAEAAGEPWTSTVPFPVQTVSRVTTSTGLDTDTNPGPDTYQKDYLYRDGFYEDREKQFRGFGEVHVTEHGDATAPTKVSRHHFFTGGPDGVDNDKDGEVDEVSPEIHREEDALKGMVRALELRDGDGTLFTREENRWLVRNLLVNTDGIEVRFAYKEQTDSLIYEGMAIPETIRTTFIYDDYGNVTEGKNYGALSITGDEVFSYSEYINDTSAWMLGYVRRQYVTDAAGAMAAETLSYYDGADFVGLPSGALTKGQLTRQEGRADGATYVNLVRSGYDSYGNIISLMNPNGYRRSITYDSALHTYPVSESIEIGGGKPDLTILAAYNVGLGVITGSTDFNGHQTSYLHDVFGRLTSIVKSGDSSAFPTMIFEYTMGNPISSIKSSTREVSGQAGALDVVQYVDGIGRKLASISEGENDFVVSDAVRFNGMGAPRYSFLPYSSGTANYVVPALNPSVVETHYDAMGRPVTAINPPDANNNRTSSSIKFFPLMKTTTDENGHTKDHISDGREQLVRVHEHNLGDTYITRYAYDALGNLTQIADALNNQKTMAYDGLGRKVLMEDPDRGLMTYEYDDAGNLIRTVDNKGQVIQYTYDGANRMLTEDYLDASGITPDVTYQYDTPSPEYKMAQNLKGKLAWVNDLSGGKFFSYDARGNMEWNINRIVDDQLRRDFRSEYQYDVLGRVKMMTYPDGDQVSYVYNNSSHLEAIPGIIANINYHPSGAINDVTYANGIETTYDFDPRYRLRHLTTKPRQPGNPIQYLEYTFDGVSNITAITDQREVPAGDSSNANQSFVYDDLYRLTRAEGPGYGAISYQYDAIGNMISKGSPAAPDPKHIADPLVNLGVMSYGGTGGTTGRGTREPGDPPGPHAITATESGLVYDYDDNGNMISHADGDIYEWDFQDRLIRARTANSVSHYVYDSNGQRIIKKTTENGANKTTWYVNDTFEIREGKQVKYLFAGDRRVARVEGRLIPSGTTTYQTLDLYPGWNFFSLTVEPDDPDITAVLAPIAGKYTEVWRFDANTQSYVGHDPGSNTYELTELHAGVGYAIYMTEGSSLRVQGTEADINYSLVSGWNLIGGPAVNSQQVDEAFAGIMSQVSSVWQFGNTDKKWRQYRPNDAGFLNILKQLKPGTVNWLQVTKNLSYSYSEDTRIFFYHPDHLGSSSLVSDSTGTVVERTEYYPYGRPRYQQISGFESEYKYTGKELDKETGLMYYEARYYDAVVGRFVSVDPYSENGNPYSYVQNNPIIYKDPTGLYTEEINDYGQVVITPEGSPVKGEEDWASKIAVDYKTRFLPTAEALALQGLSVGQADKFDWNKIEAGVPTFIDLEATAKLKAAAERKEIEKDTINKIDSFGPQPSIPSQSSGKQNGAKKEFPMDTYKKIKEFQKKAKQQWWIKWIPNDDNYKSGEAGEALGWLIRDVIERVLSSPPPVSKEDEKGEP